MKIGMAATKRFGFGIVGLGVTAEFPRPGYEYGAHDTESEKGSESTVIALGRVKHDPRDQRT